MHKFLVSFGLIFVQDAENTKFCSSRKVTSRRKGKDHLGGGKNPSGQLERRYLEISGEGGGT